MLNAILNYQFMQNAVIAGILVSIVCGIVGVIITEKKLVMMSGGIAHTAYGGVGLGYLLGFEPMIGAIAFSVMAALGIGYIQKKVRTNSDVLIGLFWSFGMALGILFIGLMPGYPPSMESYLFGNILSVRIIDLTMMGILAVIVLATILVFFQDWKSFLFDQEFAWINGLNSNFFEYLLLVLVALTVVTMIHVTGIILVIALLTAPAASASLLSNSFSKRMVLASIIGIFNCFLGLVLSYYLNISSSATIIIVSIFLYIILFAFKTMFKLRQA